MRVVELALVISQELLIFTKGGFQRCSGELISTGVVKESVHRVYRVLIKLLDLPTKIGKASVFRSDTREVFFCFLAGIACRSGVFHDTNELLSYRPQCNWVGKRSLVHVQKLFYDT